MPGPAAWVQPDGPESPGSPPQPNGNPTLPFGASLVLGIGPTLWVIPALNREIVHVIALRESHYH